MAVQNPFFGKRETESFQPRHSATSSTGLSSNTSAAPANPAPAITPAAAPSASDSSGSKLTVGPNIKLKGVEITDCDTLVVEGVDDEGMGHGHDGPRLPPTRGQMLEQRAQRRPLGPGGGLRD